jgi:hypothetical protein
LSSPSSIIGGNIESLLEAEEASTIAGVAQLVAQVVVSGLLTSRMTGLASSCLGVDDGPSSEEGFGLPMSVFGCHHGLFCELGMQKVKTYVVSPRIARRLHTEHAWNTVAVPCAYWNQKLVAAAYGKNNDIAF